MASISLTALMRYLESLFATYGVSTDGQINGLQVEGEVMIHSIVGGVTASKRWLAKAVAMNAQAVIVHHGLFRKELMTPIESVLAEKLALLLTHRCSLISYHLPLDIAKEIGNNAMLAKQMGWVPLESMAQHPASVEPWLGRVPEPLSAVAFFEELEAKLGYRPGWVKAAHKRPIRTIAWCSGAGGALLPRAFALSKRSACGPIDAFITGEVSLATVTYAMDADVHLFAAGHHATERGGIQALLKRIEADLGVPARFLDDPVPI